MSVSSTTRTTATGRGSATARASATAWLSDSTDAFSALLGLLDDSSTIYTPTNYETFSPPASKGGTYTDPVFGTTIKRLSHAVNDGWNMVVHEYAAITPFNCDSTLIVLYGNAGASGNGNYIANVADGSFAVTKANLNAAGSVNFGGFRWSRTDPNRFYAVKGTNVLYQGDINRGAGTVTWTVLHTFSAYSSIKIDGGGESDISEDGDWLIICDNTQRYVMTYQISQDAVGTIFDTNGLGAGWDFFCLTPDNQVLGQWFSPYGTGTSQGLQLYNKNMTRLRQIVTFGGHASRGRNAAGEPVTWMSSANDSVSLPGGEIIRISDGQKTELIQLVDWNMSDHLSLNNAQYNEWALFSCQGIYLADPIGSLPATWQTDWRRYYNELILCKLSDPAVRRRLCHTRSRRLGSSDYYWTCRPAMSSDGCYLVFDSNFGSASPDDNNDVYLIQLREPPTDRTAPTLSSVSAGTPGTTSATITWTTNEAATSQVEWGTTSFLAGGITALDMSLVTSHSVSVTGLTTGTLYHYRVKSRDAAGNLAMSADATFTTA